MKPGEKLETVLRLKGISQKELGERVGVSQQRVNQWVNGAGRLYLDQGLKVARALGVSLDYLADEDQEDPGSPAGELPEDERFLVQLYRDLGITREVAVRRLSGKVTVEPMTPEEVEELKRQRYGKTS